MTDAQVLTELLTIEEFVRRYDREGPFEIIDGEIKPSSPNVAGHGSALDNLHWFLSNHVRHNKLGRVFAEMPFVLTYDENWVKGSRVPDVIFFQRERFVAYITADAQWESKPFVLVPDLVVEIISPGDRYSEVDEKVEHYLKDGVRMVIVVNPQRRKVVVHLPNNNRPTQLNEKDTLTFADIIPGLEIKVADIFNPMLSEENT